MPFDEPTLSGRFTLGSRAASNSDLHSRLEFELSAAGDIRSLTTGYFENHGQGDVAYLVDEDVYFRYYVDSSNAYSSATKVFGNLTGARYLFTTNLNNDYYQDLVVIAGTATSTNDASDLYVYSARSVPFSFSNPFQPPTKTVVPIGDLVLSGVAIQNTVAEMQDAAFADFNHDGYEDIVVSVVNSWQTNSAGADNISYYAYGYYAVGLSTKYGGYSFNGFQQTGWIASGSEVSGARSADVVSRVTAGDFDGDGNIDLAFAYDQLVAPLNLATASAFIVWGDSNSHNGVFNTADSNTYTNDWDDPSDVQAVRGSASDTADQLVISFSTTAHAVRFHSDRTLDRDTTIDDIPKNSGLGTMLDYSLDGAADMLLASGDNSSIGINFDWQGTSNYLKQYGPVNFSEDINGAVGVDVNGDGAPDYMGAYEDQIYIYFNTGTPSSAAAIELAEGERIDDRAINGVDAAFVRGDGAAHATLSVIGSLSEFDNAVGYFTIAPDGTFGAARFIDKAAAAAKPLDLGAIGDGSRIAVFIVSNGETLNATRDGTYHFKDAATGEAALIGTLAPVLFSDSTGQAVIGDIFHSADANPYDTINRLNSGGQIQVLSRFDGDDLLVAFEDLRLTPGDGDFNDLVLQLGWGDSASAI